MKKKVLSVKKLEQAARAQAYNCLFDLGYRTILLAVWNSLTVQLPTAFRPEFGTATEHG
jgi:hypothetical protein